MKLFACSVFISIFSVWIFAQSGRPPQKPPISLDTSINELNNLSAEQMYNRANSYSKNKFAEFERQKVPFNDELYNKTLLEQKQLAAKYAATLSMRKTLADDDFYYLGLLHWLAENAEGAKSALEKYIVSEKTFGDKCQAARSVLVILAARLKNFDEAEKYFAEYTKSEPQKMSERSRMVIELAASYRSEKNYRKAAFHAEEAYRTSKLLFKDWTSRNRGLNEILTAAVVLFEIYRADNRLSEAETIYDDLRKTAVLVESPALYFNAVDRKIKHLIASGRKPRAMQFYTDILNQYKRDFLSKPLQNDLEERLKRREQHYKLLGEVAPELVNIEKWFPGVPQTLSSMRGKVILLDFWATWCAPCIDAFPALIEMHKSFQNQGLVILGVTRYYGEVQGMPADETAELNFLQTFRRTYNLPYDIIVAKGQANQYKYGATGIPTAVLIDRKGIVRYIESGTSVSREAEIQREIEKLLAEKE